MRNTLKAALYYHKCFGVSKGLAGRQDDGKACRVRGDYIVSLSLERAVEKSPFQR